MFRLFRSPPRSVVVVQELALGGLTDQHHYAVLRSRKNRELLDDADHAVFGAGGLGASVSLVEAAKSGQVRVTVSLDAVKSTYGHTRYRLARPVDEGGRDLSESDAEARARAYILEIFLSGGAFRIEPATPEDLTAAARDGSDPSLEDALEHQVWLRARMGRAAPSLFVTRDRDFAHGVHPARVLDQLAPSGWSLPPAAAHPE